jgi:hypothetical protein
VQPAPQPSPQIEDRPTLAITDPGCNGINFSTTLTNIGSLTTIAILSKTIFVDAEGRSFAGGPTPHPGTDYSFDLKAGDSIGSIVQSKGELYKYAIACYGYSDAPASSAHIRYSDCHYFQCSDTHSGAAAELAGPEREKVSDLVKQQVSQFARPSQRIVPDPNPLDKLDDRQLLAWGAQFIPSMNQVHRQYLQDTNNRFRRSSGPDPQLDNDIHMLNVREHQNLNKCCSEIETYRGNVIKRLPGGCPIEPYISHTYEEILHGASWQASIDTEIERAMQDLTTVQRCLQQKIELAPKP